MKERETEIKCSFTGNSVQPHVLFPAEPKGAGFGGWAGQRRSHQGSSRASLIRCCVEGGPPRAQRAEGGVPWAQAPLGGHCRDSLTLFSRHQISNVYF